MATTKKTTPKTTHVRGIANGPRAAGQRLLDARPDTADFRDRMFEPTLVAVPTHVPLDRYLALDVPTLDQRDEGACTAFGLDTVARTLLRTRSTGPEATTARPRMFYTPEERRVGQKGVMTC